MKDDLVTDRLHRTLSCTKTAAKVGSTVLGYYSKRPFLSESKKQQARDKAAAEGGKALFQGLALLKGTALKMVQQLSLESDLLPESACKELAKAYHQVPPLNRALARKVLQQELGQTPEQLFASFEPSPFAAASLGQVHRAVTFDGRNVAVKLQYPGIGATIQGDIALLRRLLAPLIPSRQLLPTLEEIGARLQEEIDYQKEAGNQSFFAKHLKSNDIMVAEVVAQFSGATVLTSELLSGKPLDMWLTDAPSQQVRDSVAQRLNDSLTESLYQLHAIQADPNPGNYIIDDDCRVGLVDFGCVKRFDPEFVELYRQLTQAAAHGDDETHLQLMGRLGLLDIHENASHSDELREMSTAMARWYGGFFTTEIFDFSKHPEVMKEGKRLMHRFRHLRSLFQVNPDFIFLDRTRYGLLRIFEMLGARVRFRNSHEW